MIKSEFLAFFTTLPPLEQARFLAHLGHDLTVVARASYDASGLSAPSERLVALNELQHHVISQIGHLIGNEPRYPDDVFIEILFETAESRGVLKDMQTALARAAARKGSPRA